VAALAVYTAGTAAGGTTERLRYGGDRAFPPFESLDGAGRPQGLQIDLLREVAAIAGFEVSVELRDWAQTAAAFASGDDDIVAAVPTPERASQALFTRPYAAVPFGVYAPRAPPLPRSLQDLVGRRIAVVDSAPMQHTLTLLRPVGSGDIVVAPGAAGALGAVLDGRADLALLPRAYGDAALAAGRFAALHAGDFDLPLQSYAFAVAHGREALRDRLDAALVELERRGRLQALRARWLDPAAAQAIAERDRADTRRRIAWGSAGAALLGAALLAVGLRRRVTALAAERARRTEAERERDATRERLALAFDQHPDPMLLSERETRSVVDANGALCRLLGSTREALVGRPVRELPGLVDVAAIDGLERLLDDDGRVPGARLTVRRADGDLRTCLVVSEAVELGGRAHVFTVVRDVTELERTQQELREGLVQLDAALADARRQMDQAHAERARVERDLRNYATHVAQGLRDPARAVHGFVGLLQSDVDAGRLAEARAHTRHIATASQRMDRMVAGLMRLARLTRAELRPAEVDMTAIVNGLVKRLVTAHPAPPVAIRVAALRPAVADVELVVQLWSELLENAWTYTHDGAQPRIAVDHVEHDGRTWYRIADNGIGFDATAVSDLFLPFQRLHARQRGAGVGLGLCVVHRIVRRHGGEIVVRSAPGVGTVVEFTLAPVAPASPDAR
jgi:PAS domain S-box-containing protein